MGLNFLVYCLIVAKWLLNIGIISSHDSFQIRKKREGGKASSLCVSLCLKGKFSPEVAPHTVPPQAQMQVPGCHTDPGANLDIGECGCYNGHQPTMTHPRVGQVPATQMDILLSRKKGQGHSIRDINYGPHSKTANEGGLHHQRATNLTNRNQTRSEEEGTWALKAVRLQRGAFESRWERTMSLSFLSTVPPSCHL